MNDKYLILLKQIAANTQLLAQQAIEIEQKQDNGKGADVANIMLQDFKNLSDKLEITPEELNKSDYSKLLVGVLIIINHIKDLIIVQQKTIDNYNQTIVPKLQEIIDTAKTDEEVKELSQKLFKI